ncbi:MAG TPA: hypothetical protein VNA89_10150 [Gemmatimonadaceae bacterium]|nr:hypothetical protein [Gemmatimonadaceae bacterium]
MRRLCRLRRVAVLASALLVAAPAAAQTDYHHLDAGRPLRVEDAAAAERHAFELHLAPLRLERSDAGATRARLEPKLAYGILPRTELEIRFPLLFRSRAAGARAGLAGIGIGALHQFTPETSLLPAIALSAGVHLPAGAAAPEQTALTAKLLATRSVGATRLHVNAALTSLAAPSSGGGGCSPDPASPDACGTDEPPVIIDHPCFSTARLRRPLVGASPLVPSAARVARLAVAEAEAAAGGPSLSHVGGGVDVAAATAPPRALNGTHLLVGLGADRTFPFRALVVMGDVYAEQYSMLDAGPFFTAEVGARKQVSPRVVLDGGGGRRFDGPEKGWFVVLGSTYVFAVRALIPGVR